MRSKSKTALLLLVTAGLLISVLLIVNGGYYLGGSSGDMCARCHLIQPSVEIWRHSTHREVACTSCHGSALTLDLSEHKTHWRRLYLQWTGRLPDRVLLKDQHVDALNERCAQCHQNAFARWKSGGHSMTYESVFLNTEQNRSQQLHADCLRCHGMYYEGGIHDLVTPLDTEGPWSFREEGFASRPAIPCLTCHQIHRRGEPVERPDYSRPRLISYDRDVRTTSLSFFDRRERAYFDQDRLPLPVMRDAGRRVEMSPDTRQTVCYQCHAPEAHLEVGSGDDRTGIGVHEGISCLACHDNHSQDASQSCATCHPKLSNCGLDVKEMDTTFRDPNSPHNIHFVKCGDCHPDGIPDPGS